MATISDLNVRLGLISKGFEQDLRKLERTLAASGRRLSSLGTELTFAVSAPLAALGASAIQQAGNLESLKLAMKSTFETAGRSAADANKEVEALRKSALAPGLDFEQAIKGSIRLQGVGYAAEAARATLEQVANAIALTGGTAENLDSVTVQFSQMIAKGKVLSQDLRIIQENMPIVSRLMQQAFGTQNAEALQAMGISGREFVDRITAAAATLPRVEGGIKNALVNAGAAARQSLAVLGEAINKTFNISGNLNKFSTFLSEAADSFANMSKAGREATIGISAFLLAAGPMVKAIGVMKSTSAELVRFFREDMLKILGAIQTRVIAVARSFALLSSAAQAFTVVGVAIAIFAAAYAIGAFEKELTAAEKAQKSVNELNRQAATDITEQKVSVVELARVLKDETATRKDQEKALKALQTIAPEQFRNLDLEKAKTGALDDAVNKYIDSLLRAARAKRAFARIEEIDRLRQSLVDTAEPGIWETLKNRVISAGNGLAFTGLQANTAAANFVKLKNELDAEEEAMRKVIKENGDFVSTVSAGTDAGKKFAAASADAAQKSKLYADALKSINAVVQKGDVLGGDVISEQAKEIENQIERLIENGFKPYGKEVQNMRNMLQGIKEKQQVGFLKANATQKALSNFQKINSIIDTITGKQTSVELFPGVSSNVTGISTIIPPSVTQEISTAEKEIKKISDATEKAAGANGKLKSSFQEIADILISSQEGINGFSNSLQQAFDFASERGQVLNSVMLSVSNSLFDAAASGAQSFGDLAQAAVASAAKVVRAWIQQGVAAAVSKALGGLPFPANLVAGASAGAIAGTLFTRALAALKVPALASGGIATSPTLAMVGEYPGAASNPEIIAPESKLRQIFRQEQGASGGQLTAVLRGDDLLFILDKAVARRGRRK